MENALANTHMHVFRKNMFYISHVQVSKTSNESKLNPLRIRIPSTNYMYIVNLQISDSSIDDIDKENLLVNVTTFKY